LEAITSVSSLPRADRRVAVRILLNQLRFTALEAVPLVVLLSGILGFLVISSSIGQLGRLGATDLIGKLMVVAENIRVVSIKMEYLMDQLSRRPLKVISGVKPLDHDSIVAQSDSAAAKK
jgi:ABC-type transporter Mla maintaining outer membrane lipid asymmetry permease subunit MlaE